jgi:phosphate transport system protein
MAHHLRREIESLKKRILTLSALVEESVRNAVKSIQDGDHKLGKKVMELDDQIDEMEVQVEEECLKILALQQPVAIDLRFIVVVLKINNDLERIGDLASSIAARAILLSGTQKPEIKPDFSSLMEKTQIMLKKSLDALVNMDTQTAREVCLADDEVDNLNRLMHDTFKEGMKKNPEYLESMLYYLFVSKSLERIADHATNIAEDVIYMIEGGIVRHKTTGNKEPILEHRD